jgi:hypothetical protein
MTFDYFRQQYGEQFYSFINTELGQAMLMVLDKNGPATRVRKLGPEVQTANAALFLGQDTGWDDCVSAIQNELILNGTATREPEATYSAEDIMAIGTDQSPPVPPAPPVVKPKTRKTK